MYEEYKTAKGFAMSGNLRYVLEKAGLDEKLIQKIVDRCRR